VIKKEEDENQERNDIAKLNWERVVILDKFVTYERETGPVSSKTFPPTHTHTYRHIHLVSHEALAWLAA
jgi:hypothetical protein